MQFKYKHDLKELTTLSQDLENFAEAESVSPAIMHCFNLCLDELLTNIISYGYDDGPEHAAYLDIVLSDGKVVATLRDQGRAFNPLLDAKEPDLEANIAERRIGGLGIHFCKEMMDALEYHRENDWNILVLTKAVEMPGLPED